MKIIVWGINYRPEPTGIGPFNAELAEFLAAGDHDVSVVTAFPYYPQWRKAPGDSRRLYRSERTDGVSVFRCWQYVPRRLSTLRRIAHELSFAATSLVRTLILPRADLYVVVSPPLILGFCAWVVTRLKWSRYVFHVQDLQPDAAVGLGMVRDRGFIRLLYALERFAYRHAAAVSGISQGMMAEFARKGVDEGRRVYFPNWVRRAATAPLAPTEFRRRFGLPARSLLAVYAGNLGRKQGIEILLDAARELAGGSAEPAEPPVLIVIAGAGAEREALARRVASLALPSLRLLPLLSDGDYAALLGAADLGLITQAPGTGRFFFPSKLLSLLEAGLPVATVADPDSELARAVATGGFGVNVAPGRPADLAAALRRLAADPVWHCRLRDGTRWVQQFEPAEVLPRFAQQIERVLNPGGTEPALKLAVEPPEASGP